MSEALAARLNERDLELIRACEAANQDLDVAEIEKEFDEIRDEMCGRRFVLSVSVYSNLHFSVVFRGNGAKNRA